MGTWSDGLTGRGGRRAVVAVVGAVVAVVPGTGGTGTGAAAASSVVRVNSGGGALVADGVTWAADSGAVGGRDSASSAPIAGTTADALYQSRRVGLSAYRVAVEPGTYRVRVLAAETWWTAPGQRVFSVTAEGWALATDVDLVRAVGARTAWSAARDVDVLDGTLDVGFTATVDLPVVSALEVTRLAGVTTPAPPPGTVPIRSGLPWASGVYLPGSSRTTVEGFGTWRSRPVDVAVDWPARRTWSDLTDPGWLLAAWQGTPYTKVFGVPPFPEGVGGSLSACAAGSYDASWRRFATNVRAAGMDDEVVVRLGWEFNGGWYAWSAAKDPAAFAACWRRVVTAAESVAPALRWDWNVSRGTQALADPRLAWPGDAYVDVVGVDAYDGWPAAKDEAGWQVQYAGPWGLKFWLDFATAHGKRLSVPEWGVYPGTLWAGHNGGDNPYFVARMTDFFRANASRIAYESYFDEPAPYYAGAIWSPVLNPRASAQYLSGYRP